MLEHYGIAIVNEKKLNEITNDVETFLRTEYNGGTDAGYIRAEIRYGYTNGGRKKLLNIFRRNKRKSNSEDPTPRCPTGNAQECEESSPCT